MALTRSNSAVGGLKFVVGAPIMMSGAVSPMARPNERMVPVRMPGIASGRTTFLVVCQRVAPIP